MSERFNSVEPVERISKSQVFKSQGNGDEPQRRCFEWVDEHTVQCGQVTPMLVIAIETETHSRYYMAGTADALWDATRRLSDEQRRWHEVIGKGPCRLYADLECEFQRAEIECGKAQEKAEQLTAEMHRFLETVLHRARERYSVELKPLLMQSHKASKWSIHIVFDGAVFRDNTHAGAFVLECARYHPSLRDYVDAGVYNRNHPLRMYRATKLDEPHRPVVMLDGSNAPPAPLDKQLWLGSLITHFVFDKVPTTGTFLAMYYADMEHTSPPPPPLYEHEDAGALAVNRRPASTGAGKKSDGGGFGDSDAAPATSKLSLVRLSTAASDASSIVLRYFADRLAASVSLMDDKPLALIECRTRQCEIKGAEHKSARTYVMLDFARDSWQARCRSLNCLALQNDAGANNGVAQLAWHRAENDDLTEACRLLRTNEWPAAHSVPCVAAWASSVATATGFGAQ